MDISSLWPLLVEVNWSSGAKDTGILVEVIVENIGVIEITSGRKEEGNSS